MPKVGDSTCTCIRTRLYFLDEPVSALDVSIQAQILNLLQDLQEKLKLTYLFVANSLNVLHHISNRIAILDNGRIVEIQKTSNLFEKPKEVVTKNLLGAMLSFYQ